MEHAMTLVDGHRAKGLNLSPEHQNLFEELRLRTAAQYKILNREVEKLSSKYGDAANKLT